MHPLNIRNIDLNDSVIINEDRTGEDYRKSFLLSELFGAHWHLSTTVSYKSILG